MELKTLKIAQELIAGSERARQDGDVVASLVMAVKASEYLQLSKHLGDATMDTENEQPK